MDMDSNAENWDNHTVAERIQACISMLYIHGYIPQSVRNKAHAKLRKQYQIHVEQTNDR